MKGLLLLGIFFLFPSLAHATLINGGFETGNFTGWSTIGDTLVVDGSFGTSPAAGTYQALINNGPGGLFGQFQGSYSGINSVGPESFIDSPLAAFFGLPAPSIIQFANTIGFDTAIEGSAIKQSFTAIAGSILSFKWNYLTDEGAHFDFAFVVLDGVLSLLADSTTTLPGSGTLFFHESGYHTFATTLASSGNHSIGIGVVDTLDPAVNSGILVDGFSVQKIPEPASWPLLGLGLVGIAMMIEIGQKETK